MGAFQIHRFFRPLPDGFTHSSQGEDTLELSRRQTQLIYPAHRCTWSIYEKNQVQSFISPSGFDFSRIGFSLSGFKSAKARSKADRLKPILLCKTYSRRAALRAPSPSAIMNFRSWLIFPIHLTVEILRATCEG
jgi:hypothetical protein